MRVKILKGGKWSFRPDLPIEEVKENNVCDMDDFKAKRLIECKCAEEIDESKQTEAKKQSEGENKAIDTTKMENKTLNLNKVKKNKGKK